MELKTVEIEGVTYAVVQEGKPVYLDGDKEVAFDAPHAAATISRLNGEAKGHREAKEAAEKALRAFEGIEDPKAALKALETVSNLDAKALIDAGKAEEMKAAAIKAIEDKYAPIVEKATALESELRAEKIGGRFSRSKYIAENLAVPVELVETYFGKNFALEEGKVVAKDQSGNVIYSKSRPGEPADFDEAVAALVEGSPFRDSILKGRNQNGSGAQGSAGGTGGRKVMSRADYEAMPPLERQAKLTEGYSLTE